MIRARCLALALLAWPIGLAPARGDSPPAWAEVTVKAGAFDRERTPIRFEIPEDLLGPAVLKALDRGPVPLQVSTTSREGINHGRVAQADRLRAGATARIAFDLATPLRKGEEGRYRIETSAPVPIDRLPHARLIRWSFEQSHPGSLDFKFDGRPVFRYNAVPVSSPNYGPIQARDAYIHPAYSPSGALVTGDFSSSHPHHRGFFLAYERTRWGDLTPDFWNIHVGTGKIHADGVDEPVVGPFTARFSARHRWEAKDKATGKGTVVLREHWDVEAYDIPGSPCRLFDLTSTQQAVEHPLEILPYRYGGMTYRGPEPFVKGMLDILTSEGKHRKDGDQQPARWVDLTGPVAEGSDIYAGAMIADHPSNPNYPNVARIHPTSLPFFCFVPAYSKPLTIAVDVPTVFRYRVMIHDGRPDPALDDRVARDFAEPPEVAVE